MSALISVSSIADLTLSNETEDVTGKYFSLMEIDTLCFEPLGKVLLVRKEPRTRSESWTLCMKGLADAPAQM